MTAPELVAVAAARGRVDEARAAYVQAIVAAHEAGQTTRAIATVAGVGHQRVWQIIDEARAES